MPDLPERCEQVLALMSEYIDGELPPDISAVIERHLADCAPCERFAGSLRGVIALIREGLPSPRPLSTSAREQLTAAWRKNRAAQMRSAQ